MSYTLQEIRNGTGFRHGTRFIEVGPDYDEKELTQLVAAAKKAAQGDSNDKEIEALQNALDEALRQLGREDLR